jgi:hypothetical protein
MTVQSGGSTRPGRAAGLLLMGIAVLAVVIGVITLIDRGQGNNTSPGSRPPTAPGTTTSRSTSGQPATSPQNNQPSRPQSSTPPANTTTTTAQPAQPQPPNPRAVPVRVFNNSKIKGLAAQAAGDFRGDGWNVVEVGNYAQTIVPTSTAYFRPGTEEEAAARALAAKFNLQVQPRIPSLASYPPSVVVITTNDYGGK